MAVNRSDLIEIQCVSTDFISRANSDDNNSDIISNADSLSNADSNCTEDSQSNSDNYSNAGSDSYSYSSLDSYRGSYSRGYRHQPRGGGPIRRGPKFYNYRGSQRFGNMTYIPTKNGAVQETTAAHSNNPYRIDNRKFSKINKIAPAAVDSAKSVVKPNGSSPFARLQATLIEKHVLRRSLSASASGSNKSPADK